MPSTRPRITESGVRSSWATSASRSRRWRSVSSRRSAMRLNAPARFRTSCGPWTGARADRSPSVIFSAASMTSPIGRAVLRIARPNTMKPITNTIGKNRNQGKKPLCSPCDHRLPNTVPRNPIRKTNRKKIPNPIAMRRTKRPRIPLHWPPCGGKGSSGGHHGGGPPRQRPNSGIGEPVADAVDGQDVAGGAGLGLDLAADVLHVGIDRALVGLDRHAVHRVEQLPAGEHASGFGDQGGQELELGGGEFDGSTADRHPHLAGVDLDVSGA